MTISLISLIESAHARYTEYFIAAATRAKAENPDVVSEFLIPLPDDSIPYPYRYFRADLMGEDEDDTTRAVELWQNPPSDQDDPEAKAYSFNLGPVTVEVHPFTWCAVQIRFDHELSDDSLLVEYLEEWMDPQDRAYDNGEPFAFAIHSATQPLTLSEAEAIKRHAQKHQGADASNDEREEEDEDAYWDAEETGHKSARTGRSTDIYAVDGDEEAEEATTLTLDLGTAPAEALIDLIERLTHDGATHIVVSSEVRGEE